MQILPFIARSIILTMTRPSPVPVVFEVKNGLN
jgi:hypothetical protein